MNDPQLHAACETPDLTSARALSSKVSSSTCYAPVFAGSSAFSCFIAWIINTIILLILFLLLIVSFGSKSILCRIRQIQFRIKHCREGNSDPGISLDDPVVEDPYVEHVHSFRNLYGKDEAWAQWMIDNRSRYEPVFDLARVKPTPLTIAFRYDSAPIAYDPPWTNEAEHMNALKTYSELIYAGYVFEFIFGGDTTASYANVIAGIPTNSSHAAGKDVFLFYELIFGHEFGHLMAVLHHYDTIGTIGDGLHMPPGEAGCLMDRTQNQYCSACRTALFIPLNINNDAAIDAAGNVIHSRYPF